MIQISMNSEFRIQVSLFESAAGSRLVFGFLYVCFLTLIVVYGNIFLQPRLTKTHLLGFDIVSNVFSVGGCYCICSM